jgi:hypothetical protein
MVKDASPNPKEKYGIAKVCLSFVPPLARILEAKVMMLGAAKYGRFNWRKDPIEANTYIDAIYRHIQQWEDGIEDDPESKVSHLAHIRACCAILLDAQYTNNLIDNRDKSKGMATVLMALETPVT